MDSKETQIWQDIEESLGRASDECTAVATQTHPDASRMKTSNEIVFKAISETRANVEKLKKFHPVHT